MGDTTHQILQKNKIRRVDGSQIEPYHKRISNNLITKLISLLTILPLLKPMLISSFITGENILWRKTNYHPRKAAQQVTILLAIANHCAEIKQVMQNDKT